MKFPALRCKEKLSVNDNWQSKTWNDHNFERLRSHNYDPNPPASHESMFSESPPTLYVYYNIHWNILAYTGCRRKI